MIFYQCLGITGVIALFYGLLAFAVTQAPSRVFWGLMIGGVVLSGVSVVKTLSRKWQYTILSFLGLNVPWILLVAGKNWKAFSFLQDKDWAGYVTLGLAIVCNGLALYVARIFLRDFLKSRSLRYGTNAVVYSVIVVGIIAIANVAGQDFYHRFDLTEDKVNTLTDQSIQLVKGLKEPLKITVFVDDRDQQKAALKELLKTYKAQSKKVEVIYADPDKDRAIAVKFSAKDGDIVVEYGGQSHVTREMSEDGITQAIVKVTRTSKPTVCFTKGHGELSLDGPDDDPRSISAIKGGMENEGYVPKGIDLVSGSVPGECGMLVIAGPTQKFTEGEATTIDQYLTSGGKSLWLMDPNVPDPRLGAKTFNVIDTGLEATAKKWGIELGRNFILEKHLQLFKGMEIGMTVLAQTYGNHPIVDPLKGKNTVFQNVRSIGKAAGFGGTVVDLIQSAPDGMSWAENEVNLLFTQKRATPDATDLQGPVTIAAAVEKDKTRLVVMGDADFVSNALVRSYEFNFDLFLNTLNWLQGENAQITIRPKKLRTSVIELSPEQANMIFYVTMIGIPMLVLMFGMDLWWIRRRRG